MLLFTGYILQKTQGNADGSIVNMPYLVQLLWSGHDLKKKERKNLTYWRHIGRERRRQSVRGLTRIRTAAERTAAESPSPPLPPSIACHRSTVAACRGLSSDAVRLHPRRSPRQHISNSGFISPLGIIELPRYTLISIEMRPVILVRVALPGQHLYARESNRWRKWLVASPYWSSLKP